MKNAAVGSILFRRSGLKLSGKSGRHACENLAVKPGLTTAAKSRSLSPDEPGTRETAWPSEK
jgi:hypothetical protein